MNYKIIVIVFVCMIIGGTTYLLQADNARPGNIQQDEKDQSTPSQPVSTDPRSSKGEYIEYRDDVIASTSGTKLLFFHAPWCPQCRALEADIDARGVPDGVTIIKVDYDSNQELRRQYGVTLQTTIVRIDDAGSLVKKYVAYDSPTLESIKNNLLE